MQPARAPSPTGSLPAEPTGLAERLAAYDAEAWHDLFEAYHARLYRYAFVRTWDESAAEDIAAEVFEAAILGIGRYEQRGVPIGAWLYRIAANLVADHLNRRRKRPQVPLAAVEASARWEQDDLDARLDVMTAVRGLTPEQRDVLLLRFMTDCSIAETATILGRTQGAVKQLQLRAVRSLKSALTAKRGRG
jgi:RNA polymerase sigma-70 factor (ECF subfamily)